MLIQYIYVLDKYQEAITGTL